MYKLYYYPRNASLAPHLVLEDMGVDFELILVDRDNNQQKSLEYLALNPAGRIPTLVHHDLVLFESSAICMYLCDQNPESSLIPSIGSHDRALFYQWLMYLNNTVQTEILMYVYPDRHTVDKSFSSSIKQAQESRLMDMFDLLDDALSGKSYLVGHNTTVCDYFLLMVSIWGRNLPRTPLALPNMGPYLRSLAEQDVVRRVFEKEGIGLNG